MNSYRAYIKNLDIIVPCHAVYIDDSVGVNYDILNSVLDRRYGVDFEIEIDQNKINCTSDKESDAWDKSVSFISLDEDCEYLGFNADDIELMQSIGISDRDGFEIFEDDILEINYFFGCDSYDKDESVISSVVFLEDELSFVLESEINKHFEMRSFYNGDSSIIRVIGNRHMQ